MPFILIGLIAAISTFQQMESNRRQQEYEASVANANATAMQQQAELTKKRTEIARQAADREAHKAKRDYYEAAGTNTSLLAAGNVDISSGSALALLEGNANRFADDMGEMEYQKDLDAYVGGYQVATEEWRSDLLTSNASYLEQTAGSVGGSLLMSGVSGISAGFGSKIAFGGGGKLKGGAAATKKGGSSALFMRQ
jgi:hypothetical protein